MAPKDVDQFPQLWLRFQELKAVDSNGHENPPECPGGIERVHTWPWYILTLGDSNNENSFQLAGSELPKHVEIHDTASIFFNTELNTFLEVPYDCTKEHVSEKKKDHEEDGWNRYTFSRVVDPDTQEKYPKLWLVGHALCSTQIDKNSYITDSWNEVLLPGAFSNGVYKRNTLSTIELAGKLTLIFGAIAFTSPPHSLIDCIRESFRPRGTSHYVPTYARHCPQDKGLIPGRGLIVKVAFDTINYQRRHIQQWEWGHHGPILTSNQDYDGKNRSSLTPNPHTGAYMRPVPNQPAMHYLHPNQYI